MRTSAILALAAAGMLEMAAAHTTVFNILVNDKDQGVGNSAAGYIRSPPNNNPITDVTSTDMTCNVGGSTATAKFVEVAGGDKITFEWHHNDNSASDDILDLSHKGPVLTYIAPAASNGAGGVWVKLAEEGYANGKWAVDNLVANRGKHSITLPNLAAGEYLLRPEIIALHEGNRQAGAQFYMECVQIKVTSSGAVTLPAGVAIPGAYTATDAGVLFDIYSGFTSYPIPGPAVFNGASGSTSALPSASVAKSTSTSVVPAPATSTVAKPAVTSSAVAKPAVTSSAVVVPAPASSTVAKPAVTSSAAVVPAPASSTAIVVAPRPTTLVTRIQTTTQVTSAVPAPTGNTGAVQVQQYFQCGGTNYAGATTCAAGLICKEWNPYYSQCITA